MSTVRGHKRPHERTHLVRNYSKRKGVIEGIALHTTEGLGVDNIATWFDNPSSQASAHVIIGRNGKSVKCVEDPFKAWTILSLNSVTLNVELEGYASTKYWEWRIKYRPQLLKLAQYIAFWHIKYGIPIQRGRVASDGYHLSRHGVIKHVDLTNAGFGTHTDPGKNFPVDTVNKMARKYLKTGWVS